MNISPTNGRFTRNLRVQRLVLARAIALVALSLIQLSSLIHASEADEKRIAELSLQMFVVQGSDKAPIVRELAAFNDKSLIPTFVLAMRWTGSNIHVAKALSDLTGETLSTWHEAYNWQERHPEIFHIRHTGLLSSDF